MVVSNEGFNHELGRQLLPRSHRSFNRTGVPAPDRAARPRSPNRYKSPFPSQREGLPRKPAHFRRRTLILIVAMLTRCVARRAPNPVRAKLNSAIPAAIGFVVAPQRAFRNRWVPARVL